MEISKELKNSIKDTVGYSEATNKESFIIGSSVAFRKCEDYFDAEINLLNSQVKSYKSAYETILTDMKTIVSIFKKYSEYE